MKTHFNKKKHCFNINNIDTRKSMYFMCINAINYIKQSCKKNENTIDESKLINILNKKHGLEQLYQLQIISITAILSPIEREDKPILPNSNY